MPCRINASRSRKDYCPLMKAGYMKRDEAISKLRRHEAELRQLGVVSLYLFGSTMRGDADEGSDADLFFDYQRGQFGLFDLMDLKARTTEILEHDADIMTRDSLHKTLRRQIEASAVRVF